MDFKKWRTEKGLSQKEAGEKLGMTAASWHNLEYGKLKGKSSKGRMKALFALANLGENHLNVIRKYAPQITKDFINNSLDKLKGCGKSKKQISLFCGLSGSALSCYSTGSLSIEDAQLSTKFLLAGGLYRLHNNLTSTEPEEKPQTATPAIIVSPDIKSDGFERIEHVMIDNVPMWRLNDVCRAIDYKNISDAKSLVRSTDIEISKLPNSIGHVTKQWVINEYGLLRILAKANTSKTEPFERWVFEEVLPSIRKTGSYTQQAQPANPIDAMILSLQEIKAVQAQQAVMEKRIALLESKPETGVTLDQVVDIAKKTQKVAQNEVRLDHNRRVKKLQRSEERLVNELMERLNMEKGTAAREKTFLTFLKDLRTTIKKRVCENHEVPYKSGWGRVKYEDMDFAIAYEELESFRELHSLSSQIGF